MCSGTIGEKENPFEAVLDNRTINELGDFKRLRLLYGQGLNKCIALIEDGSRLKGTRSGMLGMRRVRTRVVFWSRIGAPIFRKNGKERAGQKMKTLLQE